MILLVVLHNVKTVAFLISQNRFLKYSVISISGHKELKLLAASFGHGMCMKYIWNAIVHLLEKNVWKVRNPVNRIVLYRFPVQPNL